MALVARRRARGTPRRLLCRDRSGPADGKVCGGGPFRRPRRRRRDRGALWLAEALMNLTPWKLWDIRTGEPTPDSRVLEAKEVLERGLSSDNGLKHPGLLHCYIHLMEMSSTPEAALTIADHLRDLVPDAGHLRHMPSRKFLPWCVQISPFKCTDGDSGLQISTSFVATINVR